jgi:hypothetical protein
MTYNPNEHDTFIKYSPYEVILCEIDQDCVTQLHPNGQPRLFSYSSDPVNDLLNEACYELNESDEKDEYGNWVQPIPMGQKPINRAKLIELLRQAEVALSTAIHNCDSHDMDKDLRSVDGYLCQAIEEVDTDV